MTDLHLLNVKEVHEILNLPMTAVYNLFHSKGFPSVKIGGRLYVRSNALYKYIEHLENLRI